VIYHRARSGEQYTRRVINTVVVDGHMLVATLDGDGIDEVFVGQRGGSR